MESTDHEKESAGLKNNKIKSIKNSLVNISEGEYKIRIL